VSGSAAVYQIDIGLALDICIALRVCDVVLYLYEHTMHTISSVQINAIAHTMCAECCMLCACMQPDDDEAKFHA
jgi:hypothetical protein